MTSPPVRLRIGARAVLEGFRLSRSQWWSAERLRELQWGRLLSILNYAHTESPLYRDRFESAHFNAAELRSFEELRALPATTREDLQDSRKIVARGYQPEAMKRSRTSGSTGIPTVTYFDPWSWVLGKHILKLRARMACGLQPWDRVAIFQEDMGRGISKSLVGRRAYLSVHQSPADLLDELAAFAPTALYGPPSYLVQLADQGVEFASIRRIFTSAELLAGSTRRRLEEAFHAPILDVYGCTEIKEIAWQCRERAGYHVNAEWLVVEVDEGPHPDGSGEGDILVTSLFNRGMPLIRYRPGDRGRVLTGTCDCGRGLPLILPVLGRSVDHIWLPDGRSLSPYTLTCAVENVPGLRQYQIHQLARDHVLVKVIRTGETRTDGDRAILEALAPVLPAVRVSVQEVDEIPRKAGTKFRIVRSDVRVDPA